MSSKLQIFNLFYSELIQSEEYQTVQKMKTYIIDTIISPKIQEMIKYTFEIPQTIEQLENIKLNMIIEFGFYSNEMTSDYCIIDMKNFLNV